MDQSNFVKDYLKEFSDIARPDKEIIKKIIKAKDILIKAKKDKKKVLIFGNGGSAAISSHVSVDLTKAAKIRSVNFNEADLITCFANDYGYEKWIEKTIDFYADPNDVLILISSSGTSPNMINACRAAKKNKISKIITFSGHKKNNPLSKLGDLNFWVDSKAYNFVENIHQLWLLSIVDLIVGKKEYLPT